MPATPDFGPLTARGDTLVVGDPMRRHVVLAADAVAVFSGRRALEALDWARIERAALVAPTTRMPSPRTMDVVLPLVAGLLGGGEQSSTPAGHLEITTRDGAQQDWVFDSHHQLGYRRRDADAATRLLDYLVAVPEARRLLGRPAELIDMLRSGFGAGAAPRWRIGEF